MRKEHTYQAERKAKGQAQNKGDTKLRHETQKGQDRGENSGQLKSHQDTQTGVKQPSLPWYWNE